MKTETKIIFPIIVTLLTLNSTAALNAEDELDLLIKNPQAVSLESLYELRKSGTSGRVRIYQAISGATNENKYALTNILLKLRIPCLELKQVISKTINDELYLVRSNSASLIKKNQCPNLANNLRKRLEIEDRPEVKEALIGALGETGNMNDIQTLTEFQNNQQSPLPIRLAAAKSLIQLGTEADMSLIYSSLNSPDIQIAIRSVLALSKGDRNGINILKPLIKSDDLNKRDQLSLAARAALIEIETRSAANPTDKLFEFIGSEHLFERQSAYRLLINDYLNTQAKERLISIMNSNQPISSEVTQVLFDAEQITLDQYYEKVRRG